MDSKRQVDWSSPLDEMLDRNRKELEQLLGRSPRAESRDRPLRGKSAAMPPQITLRPSEAKPAAGPPPPAKAPPPRDARPAPDSKPADDAGTAPGGEIAGSADGIAFSIGLD